MAMPPILVADLFPDVCRRLVELLRSLSPDEWHRPTVSSRRTVKDVASHLLDGSLRRLSMQRDGYRPADGRSQPQANEPLTDFLNRLNDEWETGTRRLSPAVLVGLIEWADVQLADLFRSLDPHGPALFPVAWAGEDESRDWMDVARDYTEKWHHTQQSRSRFARLMRNRAVSSRSRSRARRAGTGTPRRGRRGGRRFPTRPVRRAPRLRWIRTPPGRS